jgi:NADPH-dependent ferric siderophore reductase
MRRITFKGDELNGFSWSGPAAHMKIIFPEPGQDVVPAFSPDGPRPATMRTYTPRRFDAALQTLEVDFVLHGEGPASTWAARAQAGQELVMMGPAPGYIVDAEASWYVLAGDDAALPAIETLLEAVPATARVSVFLEIAGDEEIRTLPGPERTEITWLRHDADPHRAGVRLQTALSEFAWPAGGGRVYVGCEAQAMRRIRRIVVEASGLDRERIVTRGYWRIGAVNHPDHDYALD